MSEISDDSMPKPGLSANPQMPENVGFPNTIFWNSNEFGQISKDVRALFMGGLFIYEDPKVPTGHEIRSDRECVLSLLDKKNINLA